MIVSEAKAPSEVMRKWLLLLARRVSFLSRSRLDACWHSALVGLTAAPSESLCARAEKTRRWPFPPTGMGNDSFHPSTARRVSPSNGVRSKGFGISWNVLRAVTGVALSPVFAVVGVTVLMAWIAATTLGDCGRCSGNRHGKPRYQSPADGEPQAGSADSSSGRTDRSRL